MVKVVNSVHRGVYGLLNNTVGRFLDPESAVRVALFFVGELCICRAIGYSPLILPDKIPPGVDAISFFVPLNVWAALWALSGLAAWISSIKVWPAGSVGAVLMSMVWAIGYTVTWVKAMGDGHLTPEDRDFVSASVYWCIFGVLIAGYVIARYALTGGNGVRVKT